MRMLLGMRAWRENANGVIGIRSAQHLLKRFLQSETAAVLPMAAMLFPVLIGVAGLAVDVSSWQMQTRRLQTAADAAAIAGAYDLAFGRTQSNAQSVALQEAQNNGYVQTGPNNLTVTFGTDAQSYQTVTVNISQKMDVWFSAIFLSGNVMTKTAAVAQVNGSGAGKSCLYTLNRSAPDAIHTDGGDVLNSACGISSNSNSSTAVTADGAITAPTVGVVGNYRGTINGTVTTGMAVAADPLAYIKPPTVGACNKTNYSISSGNVTLDPGVYCGGITITGTANVTLNPGTYILNGGGLTMNGSPTLTGTGVTFYNTGTPATYKPIYTQDNNTMKLSAPTSGPLAGMLFFQDRKIVSSAPNVLGGGAGKFEGVLYFPTTRLEFSSQEAVTAAYTIVVADTIGVYINSFTIGSNYGSLAGGSPIKSVKLVQ